MHPVQQCNILHMYNLLIHAIEDALRQRQKRALGLLADVRCVVTFAGRRRLRWEQEELQQFAVARNFGVAYLNYCMVGKHLLEACWDRDDVACVQLRPQTHISCDTLLWFGASPSAAEAAAAEGELGEWWEREGIEQRFRRGDASSAVGYCPVADLCRDRCVRVGGCVCLCVHAYTFHLHCTLCLLTPCRRRWQRQRQGAA